MAIPTCFSLAFFDHRIVNASRVDDFLVELGMAAYAIVHDDLGTGIFGHDGLPFGVCNKIGYMFQTVHGFESVFFDDVLVWYMTVVAGGVTAVRRMAP